MGTTNAPQVNQVTGARQGANNAEPSPETVATPASRMATRLTTKWY